MKSNEPKNAPSRCVNCRFWVIDTVEPGAKEIPSTGDCKRHPPLVVCDDEGTPICIRPKTDYADFCGDFVMRHDA